MLEIFYENRYHLVQWHCFRGEWLVLCPSRLQAFFLGFKIKQHESINPAVLPSTESNGAVSVPFVGFVPAWP